jgi:DNA-binding SARP family transcriptional activator
MLKPGMITNWTTYAMAAYMANDYEKAHSTVSSMWKFDSEATPIKPHEKNALRLLEARCQIKMGKHAEAVKGLKKHQK